MSLSAVVLAAGEGKRMRSALPKVLHPVAGRPMLLRVLDSVSELEPPPAPVVVVVGHGSVQVQAALQAAPLAVSTVLQAQQLGTGDAVRTAGALVRGRADDVLVLYGDTPLIPGSLLRELVAAHRAQSATITLLTARLADPTGYGRVVRNEAGAVQRIVEDREAKDEERQIGEVNVGTYVFRDQWLWPALDVLQPAPSGEVYLTDLVGAALMAGERVHALAASSAIEVLGVNTPEELATVDHLYRQRFHAAGPPSPDGTAANGP